jgi:hypothetical protein
MRTFVAATSLLTLLTAACMFAAGVALITRHWVLTGVFIATCAVTIFLVYPVVVGWAKQREGADELQAAPKRWENAVGAIGRAESGGWKPRRKDQSPED